MNKKALHDSVFGHVEKCVCPCPASWLWNMDRFFLLFFFCYFDKRLPLIATAISRANIFFVQRNELWLFIRNIYPAKKKILIKFFPICECLLRWKIKILFCPLFYIRLSRLASSLFWIQNVLHCFVEGGTENTKSCICNVTKEIFHCILLCKYGKQNNDQMQ